MTAHGMLLRVSASAEGRSRAPARQASGEQNWPDAHRARPRGSRHGTSVALVEPATSPRWPCSVAAAFWTCTPEEAEAAFHEALARGVNHLDIAPAYGQAEVLVGPHVPAVRDRLFVAGKSDRSNADGVRAHLERTLERLGCDHLDLYQIHGVTSLDVLDERSAAAEVILAARDEGLTRFVGITGHDLGTPRAQLEARAPLRPGHRDVPGLPPSVGRSRLPRRCGGAAGRVRRARCRGDGHQGGGPPSLG